MNFQIYILRFYFKTISLFAPKLAGEKAFKLFQKVRIKTIRKREEEFYINAKHFNIPFDKESLSCYELGENNLNLVFLLHGWESNAGSLSKIAYKLAENNYRVISFDLPGHAKYKSNYTNLAECKNAFTNVIDFVKPKKPFSILSHSFGSAVSAYTLSNLNYKIDKLVFLTSPNSILEIFTDFKKLIGLPSTAFSYLLEKADLLANEKIKNFYIDEKLKHFTFSKLLLIHDEYDKIIPVKNSVEIQSKNKQNTEFIKHKNIGHYKMLWNDKVLEDTLRFLKK
ncbi:alpha/beta hydrolase [Flavobacteriales bacterium]|nr:alpha/beta hydrolase [Flavobacteriales bacterium]